MIMTNAKTPKTYLIRRGDSEFGPYTAQQLNQMRSRNEIAATELCRPFDSKDFHALTELFPHMADFVPKTEAEREKEKWNVQGGSLASASWVAGCFGAFELLGHPRVAFVFAVIGVLLSWSAFRYGRWIQALIGLLICTGVIVASLLLPRN